MSTMDEGKRQKRPRRSFTDEFKAEAVRLVLDEGKTVNRVAKDLDLTASALDGAILCIVQGVPRPCGGTSGQCR